MERTGKEATCAYKEGIKTRKARPGGEVSGAQTEMRNVHFLSTWPVWRLPLMIILLCGLCRVVVWEEGV
jgi:hypothetical protein